MSRIFSFLENKTQGNKGRASSVTFKINLKKTSTANIVSIYHINEYLHNILQQVNHQNNLVWSFEVFTSLILFIYLPGKWVKVVLKN